MTLACLEVDMEIKRQTAKKCFSSKTVGNELDIERLQVQLVVGCFWSNCKRGKIYELSPGPPGHLATKVRVPIILCKTSPFCTVHWQLQSSPFALCWTFLGPTIWIDAFANLGYISVSTTFWVSLTFGKLWLSFQNCPSRSPSHLSLSTSFALEFSPFLSSVKGREESWCQCVYLQVTRTSSLLNKYFQIIKFKHVWGQRYFYSSEVPIKKLEQVSRRWRGVFWFTPSAMLFVQISNGYIYFESVILSGRKVLVLKHTVQRNRPAVAASAVVLSKKFGNIVSTIADQTHQLTVI